jgi:imidazolonepropionase-like amidohydrolase
MSVLSTLAWAALLPALSPAFSSSAFVVEGAAVETGDGRRLIQASVIVDDGVIVDVLPSSSSLPSGVRRVDGRGKVLSPGLVAVGSQVGLFDVGMEPAHDDQDLQGAATPGFVAGDGYNPRAVHVAVDREEGVTTAVLSPAAHKLFSGTATVVSLSGTLDREGAADVAHPVAVWGAFDGEVAEAWGGSRGGLVLGLRGIFDDVRWYRAHRAAYDAGDSRALALPPVHLRALQPLLDRAAPWVVHVDRAADVVAVLDVAAEEGLRVVVDGGAESWLVADRLKAADVAVIVHPSVAGQKDLDALSSRDDLATVLHKAGVRVAIASWATDMGTTRLRQEAGIAVQNGLPHDTAIAAITSTPAALLLPDNGARQAGQKRGVIAKGARADLVLWSGDPLEVMSVAEHVWIAGREDPTPSRPRQLADRYRKKTR